jgi:hypothetical protein
MNLSLADWKRTGTSDEIQLIERLEYLDDALFHEYVPCRDAPGFDHRLKQWLNGVGDETDRRELFSMLAYLYFIGKQEMDVLYEHAFHGEVRWWLTPPNCLISDPNLPATLATAVEHTWFCPITDSMTIAHFHHVNGIRGKDLRPDWRTLMQLGDRARIQEYMQQQEFERLVLLEDFVGTGKQASKAVEYALEVLEGRPLLIVPLIICPTGVEALQGTVATGSAASLRPVLELPDECVLGDEPRSGEPPSFEGFRNLLRRLAPLVDAPGDSEDTRALGFGAVGALSVMYTNCPNNVPPAIHHEDSGTWSALFPRSVRRKK